MVISYVREGKDTVKISQMKKPTGQNLEEAPNTELPSVGEMLLLVFAQNTWLASNPHKKYDDMTYCNLPNILDCELLRAEMAPIYLCMSGIFHNI